MRPETMGLHCPTINNVYRQYAERLLEHHRLLAEGKAMDTATEAVEEAMTGLWEQLDEVQRRSLSGLSSDLSWVRRRGEAAPRARRPDQITPQDVQAVIAAREAADWHGLLHHLRLCASKWAVFQLAYLRASAWQTLEFPRLASVFYDLAAELEPSNGAIGVLSLCTVDQADPTEALARAERITADPLPHPVAVVTLATAMLLREAEGKATLADPSRFAGLLRESLGRLHLEPPSETERVMTYQLAAIAFEFLDELPEATRYYEEGLRVAPDNQALLTGLGLLLYGRDSDRAATLFARAVDHASDIVWPYFFLAHYYLLRREFDRSLAFCSHALPIATSKPVRAELLEWSAICQSELSYPKEAVLALFKRARTLDPDNQRVARNLAVFEAGRQPRGPLQYDIEPEQSLKVRRAREARPFFGAVAA